MPLAIHVMICHSILLSVQKIEEPSELSRRYIEMFVGVKKAITMISN